MKLIMFTDTERCDFPYYVGRLLSEMTPKVIMIDNSDTQELFRAISNQIEGNDDEGQDIIERRGVTYLRDVAYSPDFFESFDYVIIHMGSNYNYEYIENADVIFAMPDYRPDSLANVPMLPEKTEYIFRDKAGKLNERSAAAIIGASAEQIVGSLEYDYNDYSQYISLLYNGRQSTRGLSENTMQALSYVIAKITGKSEKDILKEIKKERKSKA